MKLVNLSEIKNEVEFIRSVLPKRNIFDTRYNFNYIEIKPEGNNLYLSATDGFRMSLIKMQNVLNLEEVLYLHKETPVLDRYEVKVETNVTFPNTLYVYERTMSEPSKASFEMSFTVIDFLKKFKYCTDNNDNPILTIEFNQDGVFITEVKINQFRLNTKVSLIKDNYHAKENYLKSLTEPFTFKINAKFLLKHIERYFKNNLFREFTCEIKKDMFVLFANYYSGIICDVIMGINA